MKTETTERDWVSEVGAPAYAAIAEMVAALQCDRDRLEELRDERQNLVEAVEFHDNTEPKDKEQKACLKGARQDLKQWEEDNSEEWQELEAAVKLDGDEVTEEEARERIQEDALELRIFGERLTDGWEADRYELLLTTGGPAVRIVGDINSHGEAGSARLEVQDWGKPWTEYFHADDDVLMAYVACHYFGCE